MTIFTGTISGAGNFSGNVGGANLTLNESQTDLATADLTINADGTFVGTINQDITTTVSITGVSSPPQTSTYSSGPQQVSGNVNSPLVTNFNINGVSGTTTWTFNAAQTSIDVKTNATVNVAGLTGPIFETGTLLAPAAAPTAMQLVSNALSHRLAQNPNDVVLAIEAARNDILQLRDQDSTNTTYRDAEYYLIGLRAGYAKDPVDTAYVLGTPVYNAYKAIAILLGKQSLVQADPGHLNAPPGGNLAAYQGLLDGLSGKVNASVDIYQVNNNSIEFHTPMAESFVSQSNDAGFQYLLAEPAGAETASVLAQFNLHANQSTLVQVTQSQSVPVDSASRIIVDQGAGAIVVGSGNNFIIGGDAHLNVTVGNGSNLVITGDGGGAIHLGSGKNLVLGGSASDAVFFTTGVSKFDGGDGLDTAVLSGVRANYSLSGSGVTSENVTGGGLSTTLSNVERVEFSDAVVALDIQGNAGNAYRLYQAAFNRTPDTAGLSFWVHALDQGADIQAVAQGFVNAAEFKTVYGANPTNAHIVDLMYHNVLGRAGETAGINFWVGQLDHGLSIGALLQGFAVSSENHGIVDHTLVTGITLNSTAFLV